MLFAKGSARELHGDEVDRTERAERVWEIELDIVMKAGERHPRNYYAWNYARELVWHLLGRADGVGGVEEGKKGNCRGFLVENLGRIHGWCLMHPRDISGWAFLVFWIGKMGDGARRERDSGENGGWAQDDVGRVVQETKEWVKKYEWKGESVEWFLKAAKELGIDDQRWNES